MVGEAVRLDPGQVVDGLSVDDALALAVRALWHAADEDSATGGPDPLRGIFPILTVITADGFRQLSDEESGEVFATLRDELAQGGAS